MVNPQNPRTPRAKTPGIVVIAAALALVLGMNFAGLNAADEPPIVEHMTVVNDGYKVLRRQARTKAFDEESLKLVIEMQKAALAAMHEKAPMLAKVPAAEQAQFTIGFKKSMRDLVTATLDLEIALVEGNKDQVVELIDKLASIKKEGHDKFVEE